MKRSVALAVLAVYPFIVGCAKVEPGHVGVKINMMGDDRGVADIPLQTGLVWYNPFSTVIYEYPTFVQTEKWQIGTDDSGNQVDTSISFNSQDGMAIKAAVSVSYQLDGSKVPAFYVKFRSDDIRSWTYGYFRNVTRDAFNVIATDYTAEEIYSEKKGEFLDRVTVQVNQEVAEYGISVQQLGFIGALTLPQTMLNALNAKIEAVQQAQRAENELRQTEAEAAKNVAEAEGLAQARIARASAEAEANRLLTQSLSPTLLRWRQLENERAAIDKWSGTVPQFAAGDNMVPFVNLKPEGN